MVKEKKIFVLSMDGGGERGLVPAEVLNYIETTAKIPIHEMFDLICGTSTGALLAAAVCLKDETGQRKFTPADMVHLYRNRGPEIFSGSLFRWITHWIYGSKYSEAPLEGILESHFQDSRLQDTLTRVMIPVYNITKDEPRIFKSWVPQHHDLLMKDVLRAATAAPTYFKPKKMKIPPKTGSNCSEWENALLYDGAVFANNPSTCVYAEALDLFHRPTEDIYVLSLGTVNERLFSAAENPGTLHFLNTLISMIFSSAEDVVDYQMRKFLKARYTRVQLTKNSEDVFALDDASTRTINCLAKDANTLIAKDKVKINKFIDTFWKIKNDDK